MRVLMTVGCPRSGKTSFAHELAKGEDYLALGFDDIRTTLFGSKKNYWRKWGDDRSVEVPLSAVYDATLQTLLSMDVPGIVLHSTHIEFPKRELDIIHNWSIEPTLVVFRTPLETLLNRNEASDAEGKVPVDYLKRCYERMWSPGAWWREYPAELKEFRS